MLRITRCRYVARPTLSGYPCKVPKEEPEVPRIDDNILDCSVYLYPTAKDAKDGSRIGGSGFLISVPCHKHWLLSEPCPIIGLSHSYVASNRHVVNGHGANSSPAPVVRLNRHDGKSEVIDLKVEDWTFPTDNQDLAVAEIDLHIGVKYESISMDDFLDPARDAKYDIGLGDEVFMIGRLVNHEGKQRNLPSMRWGHIAMMPFEPVYHPTNPSQNQESFIIEIHSISGYSGSPVFVLRSTEQEKVMLSENQAWESPGIKEMGFWLLGVEWGYINNHDQRLNNTGMSGVVPAWRLEELLTSERMKLRRRQEQEELLENHRRGGTTLT